MLHGATFTPDTGLTFQSINLPVKNKSSSTLKPEKKAKPVLKMLSTLKDSQDNQPSNNILTKPVAKIDNQEKCLNLILEIQALKIRGQEKWPQAFASEKLEEKLI